MKIRYEPRFGAQEVEIRDITGGSELATWRAGQERDVAGLSVQFRQPNGKIVKRDAAEALLSCGPDFVDAQSGKNPRFVCSKCGEPALDEHFTDPFTLNVIYFTTDSTEDGPRLCIADWLALHTDLIPAFRKNGLDEDIIARAQQRAAAASAPAATTRQTVKPTPSTAATDELPEESK